MYIYTDIKECEIGTDNCSQQCRELRGGFECGCDTGYQLETDKISCKGILTSNCTCYSCNMGMM